MVQGLTSALIAAILTLFNRFDSMNNDFFKSFVNTLVFNLATIAAVIVGLVSYAYRAARVWYANGGKQDLINNACKVLAFVNKLSERVYYTLEDAETVTV